MYDNFHFSNAAFRENGTEKSPEQSFSKISYNSFDLLLCLGFYIHVSYLFEKTKLSHEQLENRWQSKKNNVIRTYSNPLERKPHQSYSCYNHMNGMWKHTYFHHTLFLIGICARKSIEIVHSKCFTRRENYAEDLGQQKKILLRHTISRGMILFVWNVALGLDYYAMYEKKKTLVKWNVTNVFGIINALKKPHSILNIFSEKIH